MLSKILFACILCFSISAVAQQDPIDPKQAAKDELNKGAAAFRGADYEDAIEHFSNSVRLDPELKNARLYLATAYAQQYIPGVVSQKNLDMANLALDQYALVLQRDPTDVTATKGIAFLQIQLKHYPEAREAYKKAAILAPNDPEVFYSIGVVDWSASYFHITMAKSELPKSKYTVIMSSACSALRTEELSNVEEGISVLEKAMSLRPDYSDAMAYMNLLYRLRAELQCNNKAAFEADIKESDKWTDEAMVARKKVATEKIQETGATDSR